MGFTTASHLSTYSSLVEVVSSAFGGKGEEVPTEDLRNAAPEVATARINKLLSR